MSELPSGTVTFLFTDIEGSTRLWQEHPDAMREVLARHDGLVRTAIEAHGGYVVKTTGDGAHAAFATAADAVDAAVAAQLAIDAEVWSLPDPLRVRMGLHSGPAELRDGDYYGTAVNKSARIMSIAHGGQIVASHASHQLLGDVTVETIDLGEHRLKDLGQPERIFQILHPALARDFPPLRSLDAYPGNLPAQMTSFVGRERDVEKVTELLSSSRLVTMIGVGGVGKTRLAVQIAAEVVPGFADGAWLCELAAATDPESAFQHVAAALGVRQRPGVSLPVSIREFLRVKRMFIVLDNCEHLLDAAGRLAEDVLRDCPDVRILATSREALAIDGERLWPLRSLGVPDDTHDLMAVSTSAAVQLFVDRACAARPDFSLDERNADAVVEICRRLDGVPLALELAAARASAMSPSEIAELLDERFRLLTGGRRTAVERHQALRATVDWSYSLLDERDRTVFDRLGVFVGGFDPAAARAVVVGDGIEGWDVLDALASLVGKSMLVADTADDGTTRHLMLETLRQYAREQLDETGDADAWRRRHADHYTTRVEEIAPGIHTADEAAVIAQVARDLDNLRASVHWSLESARPDDTQFALRIIASLGNLASSNRSFGIGVWALAAVSRAEDVVPSLRCVILGTAAYELSTRGSPHEAIKLAQEAMRDGVPPDCPEPIMAPLALSQAQSFLGDFAAAYDTILPQIEIFEARHDRHAAAVACAIASNWAAASGNFSVAERDAERGLALARTTRNRSAISACTFALGWAVWVDDPARAIELFEESLRLSVSLTSDYTGTIGPMMTANACLRLGRFVDALRSMRSGIVRCRDTGEFPPLITGFDLGSEVFLECGRADAAALLVGYLDGPGSAINVIRNSVRGHDVLRTELRAALGDTRYEELAASGAQRTIDQIASVAVDTIDELLESM